VNIFGDARKSVIDSTVWDRSVPPHRKAWLFATLTPRNACDLSLSDMQHDL